MKDASVGSLFKPIARVFKRFHLTLFFVFIIACLAGAVLLINQLLTESPASDAYTSPISSGTIDDATLQRIQSLHPSTQPSPEQATTGRINPFGE